MEVVMALVMMFDINSNLAYVLIIGLQTHLYCDIIASQEYV